MSGAASAEAPTASEATPLVPASNANHPKAVDRLYIHSRESWATLTVTLLFFGKASMPFMNDVLKSVQATLMDVPSFGLTPAVLGQLASSRDLIQGGSKLLVAPVIYLVGLKGVWLIVLGMGVVNTLAVPIVATVPILFVTVIVQSLVYAWVFPAATMTIAGWVDGNQLGKAFGIVAVATKVSPSIMSPLYAALQATGPEGWRLCYYCSAGVAGFTLLMMIIFLRPSARSLDFRAPTPPGKESGGSVLMSKASIAHPLADETSWNVVKITFSMQRTWFLLIAFSSLAMLKGASGFASLYAKTRLGVASAEAATVFTTYNIASAVSGFAGGFLYDLVPGGKAGIGIFMTVLNLLNLLGFVLALILEVTDSTSMGMMHVFMGTIGFASVLPVSLPFQVYAMAVGGVKHCAVIVAMFELFAHFIEAAMDLVTGELLEGEEFGSWLVVNVCFATIGMLSMAAFYYLDWSRASGASSLTAAPDLNTKDKKSIARSLRWAAGQSQTKADVEGSYKARVTGMLGSG